MKMKTFIAGIGLVTATFIAYGCVNNPQGIEKDRASTNNVIDSISDSTNTEELKVWYAVQSRFTKSLVKEKLNGVEKLDDFIEYYPVNWIEKYDSVVLTAYQEEQKTSLVSKNNVLTKSQIKLLSSLDYSSRIEVNVFYKEKNVVTKKMESSQMRRSFTIVSKYPAEYKTGYDSLIYYLRTNSENDIELSKVAPLKVGPDSLEIPGPVSVLFVVNEEGKTENVRIERTSGDANTDALLQKLVANMPLWNPAKDANGKFVKQECSFSVTESKFGVGC